MTDLPFKEQATGIPSCWAKAINSCCAPEEMTPPPATIIGFETLLRRVRVCRISSSEAFGRNAGILENLFSVSALRLLVPLAICPCGPLICK